MIRKLSMNDHEKVIAYLSEEPSINLFIIGDIEAFGYDTDFQELWAEFNINGEIKAILLRFYNSFIPYAKGEFNLDGLVQIIKKQSESITLSGKTEVVEQFENQGLPLGKKQATYFAECTNLTLTGGNLLEVKQAMLEDIDRIMEIRNTIEEFTLTSDSRNMLQKSMESNTARTYYTEENGLMTATVSTTAENSLSAMIVGVCTRKEYRRQGLATGIMERLFQEVLNEGKILCLFYDNPEAGKIYKRLGFVDIGMWTMYR
ncbi:GNAT family N-acetyltransferase [Bacillus sp. CGMCC 1.16607]|uniref:GNAT family N-acetyltransferase n=1 Tax=Bacillus sp. CGMCC 1.16607 TaxID=3351842 RepID=UPI00363BF3C6